MRHGKDRLMNREDIRYRHELKHEINYMDMLTIRQRLRAFASFDPHAPDGHYHIRSLYFDNLSDKALKEKIDGVNCREKFRIRYYNDDTSYINLEKKSKLNSLGTKYSARLSAEQSQAIVDGDTDWMKDSFDPLIIELYLKMTYQGLKPKTIVDYEREPYIFGPGNVRVTFDSHIRTSMYAKDFLPGEVRDISATDTPQDMILEVKYDAFMPEIIRELIRTGNIRQQAFSKYGACRRYG